MENEKISQTDRIRAYNRLIEKQAGRAVRPYRADGYVNLLNRYGTSKDATEHYQFQVEPTIPDDVLTAFYEGNGLFAKIIDTPAEEAIKHGFSIDDLTNQKTIDFYTEALDELDWDETAMTAIKWARLFGGSIVVMLINDGRGIDEPLDWSAIESIDDLRVYDRSLITPDTTGMFSYTADDPFRTRSSRLGMPEYYMVHSQYGNFTVHESRCLVFTNGVLPENTTNSEYRMWGIPEYIRLQRAIRDTELAHRCAPKMLDRSIQAVYKMKGLADLLSTTEGEDNVLKRLQTIDMARGMLSSITIDSEGEDYDFRQFQFSGVSEVIDSTCNFLSALTSIPQTILFGRSPAGMNSTGVGDMENYYNFVERIQTRTLRSNLRYLLSVLFQAGLATGEIDEMPKIKVKFNPLWSMSETEQADLDLKKSQIQQAKATTAQIYVNMQCVDPSEVRKGLASSDEFDIDNLLDEDIDTDDELFEELAESEDSPDEGNSSEAAPAATKLPQDMTDKDLAQKAIEGSENVDSEAALATVTPEGENIGSVGVVVVSDGKILCGARHNDFGYGLICGPGGHIENGETPEQAAFRETEEEFGISPTELIPLGLGPKEPDTGLTPMIFLCTEFNGTPECLDLEMVNPQFRSLEEIEELSSLLFQPFKDGINLMLKSLDDSVDTDGGPGSGNHGHEGVEGQIGGSAPSGANPVPYKGLGDKTKKLVEKRLENVMGFGMSREEKAETRKELISQLEQCGTKVSYDEEYDVYSVCNPECSFEENRRLAECVNFGHAGTVSQKEYIEQCHEAGVEPKLHYEKKEMPEGYLKKSDGTPVYSNLGPSTVRTNGEILEFSSTDEDINPEGYKKFREATEKAVETMTSEEVDAVHAYTSQYGVNYQRVNDYLAGKAPDDVDAKKKAEHITTALDHELGSPITVYRGEPDLSHVTEDPKLQAALTKAARGDFSAAKKLSDGLVGKTVTNPVVTSTSVGGPAEGFGKLPVQFVFKAPSEAKGVDITSISAYGGGRSSAANIFGGGSSFESEVAFKPGMSYTIERVDFGVTQDGKKQKGQVFIVASINP